MANLNKNTRSNKNARTPKSNEKPEKSKTTEKTEKSKKTEKTEKSKKMDIKTNFTVQSRNVFYTTGLKNPHAGFFFKTKDGKKEKILMKNIKNEGTRTKMLNMIQKYSNGKNTIPEGKVLNPKTGRYVKQKEETKTFKDPITLKRTKKEDGIELNKVWYAKNSLREWLDTGKNTIPHSRRRITTEERNKIYIGKNGKKIEKNKENHNNRNPNYFRPNANIRGDPYDPTLITKVYKTYDTFEDFERAITRPEFIQKYIEEPEEYPEIEVRIRESPFVRILLDGRIDDNDYSGEYNESKKYYYDAEIKSVLRPDNFYGHFRLKVTPDGLEGDYQEFMREHNNAFRNDNWWVGSNFNNYSNNENN